MIIETQGSMKKKSSNILFLSVESFWAHLIYPKRFQRMIWGMNKILSLDVIYSLIKDLLKVSYMQSSMGDAL